MAGGMAVGAPPLREPWVASLCIVFTVCVCSYDLQHSRLVYTCPIAVWLIHCMVLPHSRKLAAAWQSYRTAVT